MNTEDSLRLSLEAERHAHRTDNEYLLGVIEDATRAVLSCSFTDRGVELWLARHSESSVAERLQKAIGTLGMVAT